MRMKALKAVITLTLLLCTLILTGILINDSVIIASFEVKNQPPSWNHLFGTDQLGRDIFLRTIKGMANSLIIGLMASICSGIIALFIGVVAGTMPKPVDGFIGYIIDLILSIPHLLLLILISFCVGRGVEGVVIGLILSHWTGLARIIRAEVLSLKEETYIKISKKLGNSDWFIIREHMIPHLIPQFIIGIVILFPHAILHEASITFLGFGMPPESAAIGVMLSEGMAYVQAGNWWYLLPGVCLIVIVILFAELGKNIRVLLASDNSLEVV